MCSSDLTEEHPAIEPRACLTDRARAWAFEQVGARDGAANRDSQPRTVEAGRPAAAQIRRHPQPAARASSVGQITATASTRRPRQNRGSSTCERPQPAGLEQIARRGRIRSTVAAAWRTNRSAACPHGASGCPHCGHVSPPERN